MSRDKSGQITLDHQKSNLGKLRDPITLIWPEGGIPMLANDGPDIDAITQRAQGRMEDAKAAALLCLIAEFESRGQYCSAATTSRNHPYAVLKSEPAFQRLKLRQDDVKRIVNQCQRAGWIEILEYRDHNRKPHQRWTLTSVGRGFANLPAPTAPSAPTPITSADSAEGAVPVAPTAPTGLGGMGDSAHTQDDQPDDTDVLPPSTPDATPPEAPEGA